MQYTEAAQMLEGCFSKEPVGLIIVLLWGSLLEVQEGEDIPNSVP